jgi:hypothetical protein
MAFIAPGVYSSIIDKSEYTPEDIVAGPYSIMFTFSDRGEDNKIKFVNDINSYLRHFGEPNVLKYGLPPLFVTQWLKGGSSAFVCRLMPENATYSVVPLENKEVPSVVEFSNQEVGITGVGSGVFES